MQAALHQAQQRVEQQLQQHIQKLNLRHERLAQAMTYGVLNGGKRLRPFLLYATCAALGGTQEQADSAAVALEMVHSYSLVHDDLPAMDDDDLRRGKPTCHIAFDEATAILAGDGLLTGAFEVLATAPCQNDAQRLTLIRLLAGSAGGSGMVAGQSIDLSHVGQRMTLDELETMHRHKTGALIRAAVLMGAACAADGADEQTLSALTRYAEALGLAFQVWDDILDIEGDTSVLGKHQGADLALNKPTYPALLGMEGARRKAHDLVSDAVQALSEVNGDTGILQQLAHYVVTRDH
ncbi:MAG: (2E,6E)-farnesyl diphosphate synthase [Oceanospirillaceae bacterium]|nr:(2E,6E)-farnesyl diphosphate synthase [Oceanospirillaceae bacterium]|tara:strand:+ start:34345 stop:35226 length:882 start_codon:yes stop_codon:yes gene_type:complete